MRISSFNYISIYFYETLKSKERVAASLQHNKQFNNDVEDAHSFHPDLLYLCQGLSRYIIIAAE